MAGLAAGAGCLALASALVAAPGALAEPAARPQAAPASKPAGKPTRKPEKRAERPAATRQCQKKPGAPASMIKVEPWAQRRLGFEQAWKFTRGQGVKVAVVDSGIDADHPQLAGKVAGQFDATGTRPDDCVGHGTPVAGIIAASDQRRRNVPFLGVAPGATLLNAKFSAGSGTEDGSLLPKAITWAAQQGANVINVSVDAPDSPALRQAVRFAQARDALIVASAGNVPDEEKGRETASYPAQYPGVLSVAAADEAGTIADFSNIKTRIDVSAPGQDVISLMNKGYAGGLQGTSFGAPYASGVAALVRSRHRDLTYQQVIDRILITAEGDNGQGSGHGMISPLQAVSALVDKNAKPSTGQNKPLAGPVDIARPEPVDHRTRNIGLGVAGGALGAGLLVAFGGVVVPLGRKRNWRPGRAPLPKDGRG